MAGTATSTARCTSRCATCRAACPTYREGQTLVVCKVGGRSAQAAAYLQQQGHDVVNLDGGMLDWEAAGRPMVSETGGTPQVV